MKRMRSSVCRPASSRCRDSGCVRKLDLALEQVSTVGPCVFAAPGGIALDAHRGLLYVAEYGGHRVQGLSLATGKAHVVAGIGVAGWADGPALSAQFFSPEGLFLHHGKLYIADYLNHRIRVFE